MNMVYMASSENGFMKIEMNKKLMTKFKHWSDIHLNLHVYLKNTWH